MTGQVPNPFSMITRIVSTRRESTESIVRQALRFLEQGGVVALPTDTVYGLGARADDPAAAQKLFEVKLRPSTKPLPVLIPDAAALGRMSEQLPDSAMRLAQAFWPGALTIVVPRTDAVCSLVTAGEATVGLRVPDHPVALALLQACPFPLAVTSANISERSPASDAADVIREFTGKIEMIIDAGRCPGGVPSTVVDLSQGDLRILRAGAVTAEQLREAAGENA